MESIRVIKIVLCVKVEESVMHLFTKCHFMKVMAFMSRCGCMELREC